MHDPLKTVPCPQCGGGREKFVERCSLCHGAGHASAQRVRLWHNYGRDRLAAQGRAVGEHAKRVVLDRILRVWLQEPDLRLGQLITNAMVHTDGLFYVEDEDLAKVLEEWVKRLAEQKAGTR